MMTTVLICVSIIVAVVMFFIFLGMAIDRADAIVEKKIGAGGKSIVEEMEIAINTTTYGTMKELYPMPPLSKVLAQELQKTQERQEKLEKEEDERSNRERQLREQREQRQRNERQRLSNLSRRERQRSDSGVVENSTMHMASAQSYTPSYSPSCDSSSSSSSSSSSDSGGYSGGCD